MEKVSEKIDLDGKNLKQLKNYYYCGSIFPDIGNYSNSSHGISDLSHNLRTWNLAGDIMALSETAEELFFAYGWASHVATDVFGHPGFTNITQAEIMGVTGEFPDGIPAFAHPLEHKKTEFGASACLLGDEKNIFLWDIKLSFPFEEELGSKKSIVERAFERIYGLTLDPKDIRSGLKNIQRDIKRIPVVMKLLGSVKCRWWEFLDKGLSGFLRFFILPVYLFAASKSLSEGAVAVLKPFRLSKPHEERLLKVIDGCIAGFTNNIRSGFADMKNLNLDTGAMPVSGFSRYADALMKELMEDSPRERFKNIFHEEYSSRYESWEGFADSYFKGQKK